ncbi:beta-amyrin 28-oxidase-like [Olea europaea var. sylvestris]|uniref:beta-amyrin 28-oxidase-like n=1 Tax=Olea europaea var. sylvestris TaxID=158386 RepID=UPI000C1CF936|nr:beta-amyrin 28-oxidase-like [Olea europaea var. sylvestris]
MEKYQSTEVFKTSLMGEPVAVLCSPAGNKFLFSNENKLVTIWWPNSVRKLLGPCLATTSGDEGKQMRKMLSCFITPDAFTRLYIKTMDVVAQQHINTHWLGMTIAQMNVYSTIYISKFGCILIFLRPLNYIIFLCEGKEELKVFPIIKLYTFELACRLFMSLENPQQIAKLAALFNVFLKGIISVPLNFPGTRFFNAKRATIAIKKQLQTIVRNRRVALEQETASASQDLLSHLLAHPDENGKFMPESVIVNNILMLLFAGHDTSSVAITMLMKRLGQLPQTYEKVFREQGAIASSKEAGEFLQWEDIQKMKYSWNVVSETMRLSPPVIGAFREALVDFKYAGYDIPKGWKLYWSASLAHTDSSLFQENINFDPSRYERAGPIPFSYVPFGGGPRMCLGKEFARLEILIFLHNIVKRFQWDLLIPDEKVEYDPLPTPVKGLPVHLHPHKPLDVVASYVDASLH